MADENISSQTTENQRDAIRESQKESKLSVLAKKSRQLRTDRNSKKEIDPIEKFTEGVFFKAKIIGVEDVPDARGDRMCQISLQRLKAVVRNSGEHKTKVTVCVSIEGLKIREEKTADLLYHHPVHRISFISQDMSDARAFGYIYGAPDIGHRFYALKTEKAASLLVIAMRDLFQVVYDMKKKEIELARQHRRTLEEQELVAQLPDSPDSPQEIPAQNAVENEDNLLDLEYELNNLQLGINQIDTSMSAADLKKSQEELDKLVANPFGDSFVPPPQSQETAPQIATNKGAPVALMPPPSSSKKATHKSSEELSTFFEAPQTPQAAQQPAMTSVSPAPTNPFADSDAFGMPPQQNFSSPTPFSAPNQIPAPFGNPAGFNQQLPFGSQPQSGFNRQSPFGNQPQASFDKPQPSFDQQSPFGNQPQASFDKPQPSFDQQAAFGNQPMGSFNQAQLSFDKPQAGFDQQAAFVKQPVGSFDQPQSGFNMLDVDSNHLGGNILSPEVSVEEIDEPPTEIIGDKRVDVLADLDPLGKNRPFVNKQQFFKDLRPQKKALKDMSQGANVSIVLSRNPFERESSVQSEDMFPATSPPLPPRIPSSMLPGLPSSSRKGKQQQQHESWVNFDTSPPEVPPPLPPLPNSDPHPPTPPPRPPQTINDSICTPPLPKRDKHVGLSPNPFAATNEPRNSSDAGYDSYDDVFENVGTSPSSVSSPPTSPPIPIPLRRPPSSSHRRHSPLVYSSSNSMVSNPPVSLPPPPPISHSLPLPNVPKDDSETCDQPRLIGECAPESSESIGTISSHSTPEMPRKNSTSSAATTDEGSSTANCDEDEENKLGTSADRYAAIESLERGNLEEGFSSIFDQYLRKEDGDDKEDDDDTEAHEEDSCSDDTIDVGSTNEPGVVVSSNFDDPFEINNDRNVGIVPLPDLHDKPQFVGDPFEVSNDLNPLPFVSTPKNLTNETADDFKDETKDDFKDETSNSEVETSINLFSEKFPEDPFSAKSPEVESQKLFSPDFEASFPTDTSSQAPESCFEPTEPFTTNGKMAFSDEFYVDNESSDNCELNVSNEDRTESCFVANGSTSVELTTQKEPADVTKDSNESVQQTNLSPADKILSPVSYLNSKDIFHMHSDPFDDDFFQTEPDTGLRSPESDWKSKPFDDFDFGE